jgi:hypothetical protein
LKFEELIESERQVPKEIENMPLGELRKSLVAVSLAFKGEMIRN